MTRARATVAFLITGAVTLAFVAFGAFAADLSAAAQALGGVGLDAWAACVWASCVCAIFRFLRVRRALPEAPPAALFRAAAVHGATTALLPARLGEAALPLLLKRSGAASLVSGAGLLLLLRAFDALAAGAIGLAAFGVAFGAPWLAVAALAGLIATPFLARSAAKATLNARIAAKGRFGRLLGELGQAVSRLSIGALGAILLETLVIWSMLGVSATFALAAVGGAPAPLVGVAAAMAASFAFAAPVNGVAGVGPFEAVFGGVVVAGGGAAAAGVAAALLVHASAIIAALLALAASEIILRMKIGATHAAGATS